jgi:lipoprotein NlpI
VQKALDAEQKQLGQEVVAGFWDEARQAYERAVELQPDLAQAYFGLGVIHLKGGNREAAIAAFEAFQQHDTGEDQRATEDAAQYLEQLQAAP